MPSRHARCEAQRMVRHRPRPRRRHWCGMSEALRPVPLALHRHFDGEKGRILDADADLSPQVLRDRSLPSSSLTQNRREQPHQRRAADRRAHVEPGWPSALDFHVDIAAERRFPALHGRQTSPFAACRLRRRARNHRHEPVRAAFPSSLFSVSPAIFASRLVPNQCYPHEIVISKRACQPPRCGNKLVSCAVCREERPDSAKTANQMEKTMGLMPTPDAALDEKGHHRGRRKGARRHRRRAPCRLEGQSSARKQVVEKHPARHPVGRSCAAGRRAGPCQDQASSPRSAPCSASMPTASSSRPT